MPTPFVLSSPLHNAYLRDVRIPGTIREILQNIEFIWMKADIPNQYAGTIAVLVLRFDSPEFNTIHGIISKVPAELLSDCIDGFNTKDRNRMTAFSQRTQWGLASPSKGALFIHPRKAVLFSDYTYCRGFLHHIQEIVAYRKIRFLLDD